MNVLYLLLVLLASAFCAFRAYQKGYNPVLWFFASSVLGLVVMAFLPFTTRKGEPYYQDEAKVRQRNRIGFALVLLWMVGLTRMAMRFLLQ